jgi:antitoxin YefM
MEILTATDARKTLFRLVRQVNNDTEPVTITYLGGSAVLIGMTEWTAIQQMITRVETDTVNF